jgi:putative addiction module killer protein
MIEIRKTEIFAKWIDGLQDIRGRARIQARIERLAMGNPGDVKPVGEGISEMRIDHGPGYRVYYIKRERTMIILLAGGEKVNRQKTLKLQFA